MKSSHRLVFLVRALKSAQPCLRATRRMPTEAAPNQIIYIHFRSRSDSRPGVQPVAAWALVNTAPTHLPPAQHPSISTHPHPSSPTLASTSSFSTLDSARLLKRHRRKEWRPPKNRPASPKHNGRLLTTGVLLTREAATYSSDGCAAIAVFL